MECIICDKRFSGIENYRQHEVSEKHKKKVQMHQLINGTVASCSSSNSQIPNNTNSNYSCSVCIKSFLTLNEYQEHCNSEEHATMILKGRPNGLVPDNHTPLNSATGTSSVPFPNGTEHNKSLEASTVKENCIVTSTQPYFSKCDLCDKSFSGVEPYEQHIESKLHKKKAGLMMNVIKPLMDVDGQAENIYCSFCNERFITKELFKLHIDSDGHKDKISQIPASFDKIKCDACAMEFTGPIPYGQHINSENHKKKLKMNNPQPVVNDLNMNAASNVTAYNKGSLGPYFCEICNIPCSGPDPFRDHIKSKKHIKKVGQAEYESNRKALQDISLKDSKLSVDFGFNKPNEDSEMQSSVLDENIHLNTVNPSELNLTSFKVDEEIDFDKKVNNIETIDFDKIEDEDSMDEDDNEED